MIARRRTCEFLLVAALIAGSEAGAQDRLSMEAAVSLALQNNRMLQSAGHDRDAARWGKLNALTNFLPRVEVSTSVTRIDPDSERRANAAIDFIKASAGMLGIPPSLLSEIKPFAYRDTYATELTVLQPLYNGGAELVGVSAAAAQEEKAEFSYADMEQDVIAKVRIGYLTLLKADRMAALARESVERTRKHVELTARRAGLGMRTRTDVLRWEVQLAADEGTLVQAANGFEAARLQLNEIMGVSLDRVYTLTDPVPDDSAYEVSADSAFSADGGTQPAGRAQDASFLDAHPTMRAMQANLALAEAGVDQAWVNFKPRVNAFFQYGWEKDESMKLDGIRPWALGLSLSWPIFSGFGDYTRVQKAEAEYRRTGAQVDGYRRALLLQSTAADLAVRAARTRIAIARKGKEEAREVLSAITHRYESGGASSVDLLDVQTAYASAGAAFITAVYDYRIAEVQRSRANGTLQP